MACVCGHAIEDHEDERGPCEGIDNSGGTEEDCDCVAYEEDEEDQ